MHPKPIKVEKSGGFPPFQHVFNNSAEKLEDTWIENAVFNNSAEKLEDTWIENAVFNNRMKVRRILD